MIYLLCQEPALLDLAGQLAEPIPTAQIINVREAVINSSCYLLLQDSGLYLYSNKFAPFNLYTFYAEFITKRRQLVNKELLIRAAKLSAKPGTVLTAVDLTAGLGRDSIILALAGYTVTLVENNPFLGLILNYLRIKFGQLVPNLTLKYASHYEFLRASQQQFDLVYYDPMFADGKMALAKKDMQLIDFLVTSIAKPSLYNADNLLELVKSQCRNKLIVKRDNKQLPAFHTIIAPTYSLKGRTVRFDVYQY